MSKLGFDTSQASCKGVSTEVFYPVREPRAYKSYRQALKAAVDICEQCVVKEPCLDYALNNESMGIWGGTTEFERHMMRQGLGVQLPKNRLISETLTHQLRGIDKREKREKKKKT